MAPTLLEILNKTTGFFQQKGIPNHRLDAQLLLGHVLGLDRIELYLNYDRPLTDIELDRCREVVRRRAKREPLQHIIGFVDFRNLKLKVDKRALIPRKETEIIVDIAMQPAITLSRQNEHEPINILDVGVGAGSILLSLVKELEAPSSQSSSESCSRVPVSQTLKYECYGCDINEDALALTRENAVINNLEIPDARLFVSDGLISVPKTLKLHGIISNPPYIALSDKQKLQIEVRDFDPPQALYGGPTGTEFPIRLMNQVFERLVPGGFFIMEFGHGQMKRLYQQAKNIGWENIEIHADYSGSDRFISLKKLK